MDYADNVVFDTPSVAYSCIYVEVPTAVEAQVRAGSGLMKIWLNDNSSPVIEVNAIAGLIPLSVTRQNFWSSFLRLPHWRFRNYGSFTV